ncbi:glycosyltransferase [bacterium]|nr:glycosyltransferase [bacterium]
MNNIDISVIIPAHNTALYLKKCLDSMVNQTAANVEIIIVDDASEPTLKSILYEKYKNYQNITYLRNETPMRPGGARNRGLDIAHGRYITFCDSDDWVDLNYFEQIIKYMDSTMADIGMVSMMRNDDYSPKPIYKCYYDRLYTLTSSAALKILSGSYDMGIKIVPACINKVYRREFISTTNSRFEQDIYFQGILYSVYTFLRAQKIICIPGTAYHHYLRINSITQSFDQKHINDFVECFTRMKAYFENIGKYEEYAFEYYRICEHYINILVSELFEYIPNETAKKTYLLEIINAIKNVVNFDDYYKYITAEQLRHHIQPHIDNTFDILY